MSPTTATPPTPVPARYCPVCFKLIERRAGEKPVHYIRWQVRFCAPACQAEGTRRRLLYRASQQLPSPDPDAPPRPLEPHEIGGLGNLPVNYPGAYWILLALNRCGGELLWFGVPSEMSHIVLPSQILAGELGAVTVLRWRSEPYWHEELVA